MKWLTRIALLAMVPALLLCGCADEGAGGREDAFRLSIMNDCEGEIYGVHIEYALDGEPTGGGVTGAVGLGKVQPIERGDDMTWEFDERDFPEQADLTGLSVEVYVVLAGEKELLADGTLAFSAEYGRDYFASLSGSEEAGFSVSMLHKAA